MPRYDRPSLNARAGKYVRVAAPVFARGFPYHFVIPCTQFAAQQSPRTRFRQPQQYPVTPRVRMPRYGEYAEVTVSDRHRAGPEMSMKGSASSCSLTALLPYRGPNCGGIAGRRIRFHNRRSMGQPDGTAIRHKQPVPQCTPRLDLMQLLEAALRHTAGCFFRHLLTCLTIATGIGRYIVFAYPLTLLRKFPAVSAGQSG